MALPTLILSHGRKIRLISPESAFLFKSTVAVLFLDTFRRYVIAAREVFSDLRFKMKSGQDESDIRNHYFTTARNVTLESV